MRTRGCWRNLFKTEDRWEVCPIERPYHVSTVYQDALFTNIIPQSHQLHYPLFDSRPGPCYCVESYEPALLLARPHLITLSQRD